MSSSSPNLRTIFADALERAPGPTRAAFLDEACGEDPVLRERVEALLAAEAAAGDFLQGAAEETGVAPGSVLGPYRLQEVIGEGGFGVVYVAEQTAPVRRRVALKVIKAGMDTREVVARFEAERQALALMDHPHIARVYDAGATPTGRPYFVMELVQGVAIHEYCDRLRLPLVDRLELFVQVCRAVQHAHQKGVIHRDLKPSNVLVGMQDGRAAPKVIDFGVAKATGQRLTEATFHTRFAQVIGTPLYMSPEQAELSALDVDTRSDVYSLGVLLYELLTGTTPFERERLASASFDELRRILREEEPPTPSVRLTTRQDCGEQAAHVRRTELARLIRQVGGDLDWIVMKALEKDRTRRYESASALAADVERHLTDQPVEARPPSAWYRASKLARRHRVRLAVLAAAAAILVTLLAAAGWTLRERNQQAARMEQLVDQARTESMRLRESAWMQGERLERAQEMLTAADKELARARSLIESVGGPAGDHPQDPLATLAEELGRDQQDLQMIATLERILLERVGEVAPRPTGDWLRRYREAFAAFGVGPPPNPPENAVARLAGHREPVREALLNGILEWLDLARSEGHDDQDWLRAVLGHATSSGWQQEIIKAVVAEDREALEAIAQRPELWDEPGSTLRVLAVALVGVEAPGTVRFLRKVQELHPGSFWANVMLARELRSEVASDAVQYYRIAVALRPASAASHLALGVALEKAEELDRGIEAYERAIELEPDFALAYYGLGTALSRKGEHARAIPALHKAVELAPHSALAHNNLGVALGAQGDRDGQIAAYREAGEHGAWQGCTNLANILREEGDFEGALAAHRQAIALAPDSVEVHYDHGITLGRMLDHAGAVAAFRRAVDLAPTYPNAYFTLANHLLALDRLDEAVDAYRAALEVRPDHLEVACNLGVTLTRRGDVEGAIAVYQDLLDQAPDPHAPDLYVVYAQLGHALHLDGDIEAAVDSLREAAALAPDTAAVIDTHNDLGIALHLSGDLEEAAAVLREAILLNPDVADLHNNLGAVLLDRGEREEAIASFREAVDIEGDAGNGHARFNLAETLALQGDRAAAIEAYRGAIVQLDQHVDRACNGLAWLLAADPEADRRQADEAVELAERAIRLDPTASGYWNTLGAARYRAGDDAGAVEALERSVELQGGGRYDWLFLAMARERLGEDEAAQACLHRALEHAAAADAEDPLWRSLRAEAEALLVPSAGARTSDREDP